MIQCSLSQDEGDDQPAPRRRRVGGQNQPYAAQSARTRRVDGQPSVNETLEQRMAGERQDEERIKQQKVTESVKII